MSNSESLSVLTRVAADVETLVDPLCTRCKVAASVGTLVVLLGKCISDVVGGVGVGYNRRSLFTHFLLLKSMFSDHENEPPFGRCGRNVLALISWLVGPVQ